MLSNVLEDGRAVILLNVWWSRLRSPVPFTVTCSTLDFPVVESVDEVYCPSSVYTSNVKSPMRVLSSVRQRSITAIWAFRMLQLTKDKDRLSAKLKFSLFRFSMVNVYAV